MGKLAHKDAADMATAHKVREDEWKATDTHLIGGVANLDIVTTAETQTLTNKTLTTPVIATLYQDAGKTKLITFPATTGTAALTSDITTHAAVKTGVHGLAISAGKTITATDSVTLAINSITLAGGEVITFSATNALSLLTSGATVMTFPAVTDTVVTLAASQTLTNKTLTSPVLATPTLGVATATSINKLTLTQPATGATLTLVEGSSLITAGAYAVTLTATNTTGITLPTTGTLATLAGTEELDNKTLDSSVGKGTWTASGTWTLPAITLGGAVTLNGQTFDAGAGTAQINTTGGGTGLQITSSAVGVAGAYVLLNQNSSSPAANDFVGTVRGLGKDSAGNAQNYSQISFMVEDPTSGAEAGKIEFYCYQVAAANQAMTLSSAGGLAVDLDNGGTDYYVSLFDKYDDAIAIKKGIQENNRELLADMGILDRKDTGSGYMLKIQPMFRFQAGAIYQTRALLEALARKVGTSIDELIDEVKQLPDSGWEQKQLGAG